MSLKESTINSNTTLRPIERSLPLQLLQSREAAMALFRPMLRGYGLTEQQWRVVRVLAAAGPLDASGLAEATFLLPPSLTRILQALEEKGLIHRETDPNDQRRVFISLSAAGEGVFASISPDSERLYRTIEARFGAEKLQSLQILLAEFNATLAGTES